MTRFAWIAFVVAEIGMLSVAFLWPLVDPNPAGGALRIIALTALFCFIAALLALLAVRVQSMRDGK